MQIPRAVRNRRQLADDRAAGGKVEGVNQVITGIIKDGILARWCIQYVGRIEIVLLNPCGRITLLQKIGDSASMADVAAGIVRDKQPCIKIMPPVATQITNDKTAAQEGPVVSLEDKRKRATQVNVRRQRLVQFTAEGADGFANPCT